MSSIPRRDYMEVFPSLRTLESSIGIWWASLDEASKQNSALSADELARAAKFHDQIVRRRFIAAQSKVREVLGDLILRKPRTLRLAVGPYGKPYLRDSPRLQFSLSHSFSVAAVAVTMGTPIGVDCELVKCLDDFGALTEQTLTASERQLLRGLNENKQLDLFFQIWTRKEAVLKAVGVGLCYPPTRICVMSSLEMDSESISVPDHGQWHVRRLNCPVGYQAACCTLDMRRVHYYESAAGIRSAMT